MKEYMKVTDVAMEALLCFEKHLGPVTTKMVGDVMERQIRTIVDSTDSFQKQYEIGVQLKKGELAKSRDEIVRTIIDPACFHMAERIKELGPEFNTFIRILLPEGCESARTENNGISITVVKEFDVEEECEVLKISVGIAYDR